MKLRLTWALTGALLLVALLPGAANAAIYEQAASSEPNACYNLVNSSAGPNACLGETWTTGDWPGGDLFILTNGSDITNLYGVAHGLPGACDEALIHWNDCLTDAYVKLPAGTCFRAYTQQDYLGERVFAASNWAADPGSVTKFYHFPHLVGSLNNTISSIRLYSC